MKRLYIVRHGETDMNRRECLQGHIDCDLNDKGIKEAKASYELFKEAGISFEKVYSSPLKRAFQTAQIIAPGSKVCPEPLIIEMHFGSYEGMPYSKIDKAMWAFIHDPENVSPPEGVEAVSSLNKRTGSFISRLLSEEHEGCTLIVTHGIALRSILWNLSDEKDRSKVWSMPIENCIVYEITAENGKITGVRRADELSRKSSTDTSGAF